MAPQNIVYQYRGELMALMLEPPSQWPQRDDETEKSRSYSRVSGTDGRLSSAHTDHWEVNDKGLAKSQYKSGLTNTKHVHEYN